MQADSWAVAHVGAQTEFAFARRVNERLAEFHECYCPVRVERRRYRKMRHPKNVSYPVFRGYVFLRIRSIEVFYESMLTTIGIYFHILKNEGHILAVPNTEIERIKARELKNDFALRPKGAHPIHVGDIVEVIEGPFVGKRGIVKELLYREGYFNVDLGGNFNKVELPAFCVRFFQAKEV